MGAFLDIVVDDVTGLLVPHGNEGALRTALRRLTEDAFFREGLGLAGRDRAVSRFDWSRVTAEAVRVYERSRVAAAPMGPSSGRATVRTEPAGVANEFPGTLRVAAFLGDHLDCLVEIGDTLIRARAHPGTELRREQQVYVELPLRYCIALPDDGWRPRALSRSFEEDE